MFLCVHVFMRVRFLCIDFCACVFFLYVYVFVRARASRISVSQAERARASRSNQRVELARGGAWPIHNLHAPLFWVQQLILFMEIISCGVTFLHCSLMYLDQKVSIFMEIFIFGEKTRKNHVKLLQDHSQNRSGTKNHAFSQIASRPQPKLDFLRFL